jgi:uncharacterized protein involved in outer membrane biogenesis
MGMTTKQKRLLFIAGSVIGLFLVSLVALLHFIDINSYKPQIEAAVHDHLGMDLKINGKMGIVLFPGFGVSLTDVNLRNKGTDLLTVKKVRLGLKLLPLIRHEVAITDCGLVGPVISVVREADGTFNFETRTAERKAEKKAAPLPLLTVRKFTISGGSIIYSDKKSGGRNELRDFDFAIKKLSFPGKTEDPLRTIALSGDLTCRSLKIGHFTATNLRCPIRAGKGIFNFGPFVMDAFGGTGRGTVEVDARSKPTHFKIGFKTPAFSLQEAREKSEAGPELRNLELNVTDLSFSGDNKQGTIANISLAGNARCGSLKIKKLEVSDLTLTMKGEKGVFDIAPISMNFYGGAGKGSLSVDISGDVARYSMRLSASGFSSEQFLAGFSEKRIVKGEMDFLAHLTAAGKNGDEMKRGLGGEVMLKGENLFLYGLDLDQLLAKIEESRSFSLVDVGAYFFVGPFGTLFTKGYNFADIAVHAKGGQSAVRQLVSKWSVTQGVAEAEDVALATNRHRLAVKGNLDFVGDRFDDITVAVLDKKGCAALTQKISGPFSKPQMEKVNVLTSLVAPVVGLVKKVGKLFAGGKCKVFYTGSVKPPE